MINELYDEIKASEHFPSPTGVALEVLRLAESEYASAADVARVVEADPAIASRLLRVVNSPLSGLFRRVASVSQAVALLGMHTVKTISLGFSLVSDHRNGNCEGFDYDGFWSESLGRAVAMRHLAEKSKALSPDEAFTYGLLSQFGRLALASVFQQKYQDLLFTLGHGSREKIAEAEEAVFGIHADALTARMMKDWGIPDIFCDILRDHAIADPDGAEPPTRSARIAELLRISIMIGCILGRTKTYRDQLATLMKKTSRIGLDPVAFCQMFDSIAQEWREFGKILSISTAHTPSFTEIYSRASERRQMLEAHAAQS